MTKEDLAATLDGTEYPLNINRECAAAAKSAGLVIVFGASDDLMEFRGAIEDEIGAYEGTTAKIDKEGVFASWEDLNHCGDLEEEEAENYFRRKPHVREIKAIWDRDGYSFIFETGIPHATFEVMEDGEKYCRGIVFSLDDLGAAKEG